MTEIWRDIPGFEGKYQASTEGRIRSVAHEGIAQAPGRKEYLYKSPGKILSTCIGSNGYKYVGLRRSRAKTTKFVPVHHLVALTFFGERPTDYDICHADGDKLNNAITNLRYDSRTENRLDVYRQGKRCAKLSIDQVREIRTLFGKKSLRQIAEQYGVSVTSIANIKYGRRFSWLE